MCESVVLNYFLACVGSTQGGGGWVVTAQDALANAMTFMTAVKEAIPMELSNQSSSRPSLVEFAAMGHSLRLD